MPHHRDSEYHERHDRNARVGVPEGSTRRDWGGGAGYGGSTGSRGQSRGGERGSEVSWIKSI